MRILIIDDSLKSALALAALIEKFGYTLAGCVHSLSQAGTVLKTGLVDVIISDVLVGDASAVAFLNRASHTHWPVIFATTCTDDLVYERTISRKNTRYLIKPFHALTLRAALDSVMQARPVSEAKKGIAVRGINGQRVLVDFETVYYIRVERNYCFLLGQNRKYALKISLVKLMQQLDERFVQIHKGYCINGDYITRTDLSGSQIFVKDEIIPIGYTYRKNLVDFMADRPG